MTEQPARHRRGRSDDLAAVARARLERAAGRVGQRGWVPSRPAEGDGHGDIGGDVDGDVDGDAAAPAGPSGAPACGRGSSVLAALRPDLSRPALAALAVVLAVGVLAGGVVAWAAQPSDRAAPTVRRQVPVGPDATSVSRVEAASRAPASPTASSGAVVVHVAGAVRRAGLVRLPAGSRVGDAVDAAGGPTGRADLASVNLARPLEDGEQVLVLRRGQVAPVGSAPATGGAATGAASGAAGGAAPLVDLNTAGLGELDQLPGVGPVLAQRILDWRAQNGAFASVEELIEVSGIGDSTMADLRPLVRV